MWCDFLCCSFCFFFEVDVVHNLANRAIRLEPAYSQGRDVDYVLRSLGGSPYLGSQWLLSVNARTAGGEDCASRAPRDRCAEHLEPMDLRVEKEYVSDWSAHTLRDC